MATLGLMPVWGLMYVRALTEAPEVVEGPLGIGAEQYGSCAACHGAAGGGGVGYAFAGEEVLKTFPNIEDQLRYVYWGTGEYNLAEIEIYGNPEREGGPHLTGALGVMPQQGSAAGGGLTDYEILGVVCHERYTLGGADPTSEEWSEEFETFCSAESPVFEALEGRRIFPHRRGGRNLRWCKRRAVRNASRWPAGRGFILRILNPLDRSTADAGVVCAP